MPWWTRHDFHHHARQRPSPGGPRKRRRGKGRHAVTGCAPGSRGRVFRAGPRDGADQTGLERGREGRLTPGTLFLRRPPDSSTVLEVPFRCLVSRRPAQHQGWAAPRAPPAPEGWRGFVPDARLHQLQRWLQPLIKLLLVTARSAETRLLLNRPFRPRCRMIRGN